MLNAVKRSVLDVWQGSEYISIQHLSLVLFSSVLYLFIPRLSMEKKSTIPHINSETNPPPPIINIACKYLRVFLGTSFGIATLPICRCMYQGVRNVRFLENFTYVPNEWSLLKYATMVCIFPRIQFISGI